LVTKTLLIEKDAVPTSDTELGSITVPSGVKRRVVEVTLYYSAAGRVWTKRDTEDLDTWTYECWAPQILPKYVDVELTGTNKYTLFGKATTGTINIKAEIKIEETPIA